MALDCLPATFPAAVAANTAPQGGDVLASMAPGIVGFPETGILLPASPLLSTPEAGKIKHV